jgi:transcriptional regulatory protein GAL4
LQDLTVATTTFPGSVDELTTYTSVRAQTSFHLATNPIYSLMISTPFPTPKELLALDHNVIGNWLASLPGCFNENAMLPRKFALAHAVMMWRCRNFRLIMYRPFVIRRALQTRAGQPFSLPSPEEDEAYSRCIDEAEKSITSIHEFWRSHDHTRLAAWYAL